MANSSILLILTALVVLIGFLTHRSRTLSIHNDSANNHQIPSNNPSYDAEDDGSRPDVIKQKHAGTTDHDSLRLYKELYHKVQNIEAFPDILPLARTTLISLLSEAVKTGSARSTSILSIKNYDPASLSRFLSDQHNATLDLFVQYTQRRAAGKPREMFADRRSAIQWLTQAAPLKYVDGAWLGGIHKASTPFYLRRVTRLAWQVLSEELGDGDLSKHHVHLYRELLQSLDVHLPDADAAAFVSSDEGDQDTNDFHVWKSAVAQLLISLFPHDFLPEILGFNLHFELLTNETLMAARELPELGINGYYFTLHISIDNTDSGHSAMALEAVSKYMSIIQEQNTPDNSVQDIWRRVQAGYLLSETLSGDNSTNTSTRQDLTLNPVEARVFDMIRLKAIVSNKIHAACRARIGSMSLAEWLEPPLEAWGEQKWRRSFLNALASASPWVRPGESNRSLLVRELGWKGRMFGAFTQSETEDLCAWIDGLSKETPRLWTYDDVRIEDKNDPSELFVEHPHTAISHLSPTSFKHHIGDSPTTIDQFSPIHPFIPLPSLQHHKEVRLTRLLPIWFSHTSLLENTVTTPYRTATQLQSHILSILRVNYGLSHVENGIAGMDEDRQSTYSPDLIDIGLSMLRRSGLPEPTCLRDTLAWPSLSTDSAFAHQILRLSRTSHSDLGIQVGLSRAFLDLEDWVARHPDLLDDRDRKALVSMVERKVTCFVACSTELARDDVLYADFVNGYRWGRNEIEKVFCNY